MSRYVLLLRDTQTNKTWLWRSKELGNVHTSLRNHINRRRRRLTWTPYMDQYIATHYYRIPAFEIANTLRGKTNQPVTKNAVVSRFNYRLKSQCQTDESSQIAVAGKTLPTRSKAA